jgi:hypothetical protein
MKNLFYCLVGLLFFSCNSIAQTDQERRPITVNGVFSVAADYVSGVNGCFTVNVRVYLTWEGQTVLLANQNVQVGECGQRRGTNANPDCPDQVFKGDYFYSTKDKYKYCLIDLLQDEVIYSKYVIEKNRVINAVKK